MSSRTSDASAATKGKIVALPSLTCQLSALPQAKNMDSVSLHPSMYAHRAAESEAKLQRALSKTASSFNPQTASSTPAYMNPPHDPHSNSSPLMMRKSQRPKLHA